MTIFSEKMQQAGVDTLGARLTTALIEGIKRHPESVVDAWRHAGSVFGYELARSLMKDMQRNALAKEPKLPPTPLMRDDLPVSRPAPKPYQPRVIPPERLEKRRELLAVTQKIVRSKYKTYDGRYWDEVGWHELPAMGRCFKEAMALLEAGPANVPNDGRNVGDVLGAKKINEVVEQARRA